MSSEGNLGFGGKTWPSAADVWQCHLRADGLTPEISTGPNARSRVMGEPFTKTSWVLLLDLPSYPLLAHHKSYMPLLPDCLHHAHSQCVMQELFIVLYHRVEQYKRVGRTHPPPGQITP